MTDSEFEFTGGYLQNYGHGCLNGDNTLFTRTTFKNILKVANIAYASQVSTIRFVDCIFETPINYIVAVTVASCNIDVIMIGTTFVEPVNYLFYNNQTAGDLSIDVSDSNGTVTAAKVRNSKVDVIACDLAYV
jgi:hypothetical protein